MTELHNLVHSCIDNMSSEKRDFHRKMVSDDTIAKSLQYSVFLTPDAS